MLVRIMQSEKNHAKTIEMTVAAPAAYIELTRDSLNLGMFKTAEMSLPVIFVSITTSGQNTANIRKRAINSFTG